VPHSGYQSANTSVVVTASDNLKQSGQRGRTLNQSCSCRRHNRGDRFVTAKSTLICGVVDGMVEGQQKTVVRSMAFLHSVTPADFLNSLVSLFVAFALGAVIGAERQYRQRSGGLRTNALVAVGAATFVDVGMHLNGNPGATQVIAYVVSGIGFLGAGVIMKEGKNVWGLNTAATLWCSGAVGACAGADLAFQAVALTGFVLAGNTLLRPIVNAINRLPIREQAMEATYEVRLSTNADHLEIARENLEGILEQSNYALRDIDVIERDPPSIEIVATLAASSADPLELDRIVKDLRHMEAVEHSTWSIRAPE